MNRSDYGSNSDSPHTTESDQVLSEFVVRCNETRSTYPGLCAIDFQNVIAITIRYFLGWDKNKGENIVDEGLFGNLDA